jgi:hypothetical protein
MGLLPSSPRRRRRVLTLGGAAIVALIVGGVFLLLPSNKPPNPVPTGKEGAAQLVAKTNRHVSAADRKLIDTAFDHFIPNALNRKHPDVSWAFAGPDLRAGATHTQWLHGTMPVPQYPAADSAQHGWRVLDATKTTVDYSLLVHPRKGTSVSDWVFQGELIKVNGRWLVDTIYTTAIMAKPHNGFNEVGPADFAAGSSSKTQPSTHAALSRTWLSTLIGILVGVLVLVPLIIGTVVLIRRRRWQRRGAAEGRTKELPSLPPSARKAEDRDRTPVA